MSTTVPDFTVARRVIWRLALCLAVLAGAGAAQPQPSLPIDAASSDLGQTLRVKIHDNLIFVPVRVNGSQPYPFILDTGASETLLNTTLALALNIDVDHQRDTIAGTGEGSARLGKARDVQLGYGDVELQPGSIATLPLTEIEAIVGRPIGGILGAEIFKRWIVTIDYVAPTITLRDPALGPYRGSGEPVPLRVSGGRPFFRSRMTPLDGPAVEGLWVIDTGDSSTFGLHTPFVEKNRLRSSSQHMVAHLTHGIAGTSRNWRGRLASLQLGRFSLDHPVATFAEAAKGSEADRSYDGAVGGGILRRFTVTLDYAQRQMFLEPNPTFADPFDFDLSGLSLAVDPPDFGAVRVTDVQANSLATAAGFQDGDVLEAVDARPISAIGLDGLRELFKTDGRDYAVRVKRGDASMLLTLKIRRAG